MTKVKYGGLRHRRHPRHHAAFKTRTHLNVFVDEFINHHRVNVYLTLFVFIVIVSFVYYWQKYNRLEVSSVSSNHFACVARNSSDHVIGCSPPICGRFLIDEFADQHTVHAMLELVDTALETLGGDGPPSIVDLHRGIASSGTRFVDLYKHRQSLKLPPLSATLITVYEKLIERVRESMMMHFNVQRMWLTAPGFFSRINGSKSIVTDHDIYTRSHVDTEQYEDFEFTALVYLNDQGVDYSGGHFIFDNEERTLTVQPKSGLLLGFTSGHENIHHVQHVSTGVRYALTIAFTCDASRAVLPLSSRRKY